MAEDARAGLAKRLASYADMGAEERAVYDERLEFEIDVINRMGFPSKGSEFMQLKLNPSLRSGWFENVYGIQPRNKKKKITSIHKGGAILGINLGKNKKTPNEEAVLDTLELLQHFAGIADYLTIKVSHPQTCP